MYIYTPYIKIILILAVIVVLYLYFTRIARKKPGNDEP